MKVRLPSETITLLNRSGRSKAEMVRRACRSWCSNGGCVAVLRNAPSTTRKTSEAYDIELGSCLEDQLAAHLGREPESGDVAAITYAMLHPIYQEDGDGILRRLDRELHAKGVKIV